MASARLNQHTSAQKGEKYPLIRTVPSLGTREKLWKCYIWPHPHIYIKIYMYKNIYVHTHTYAYMCVCMCVYIFKCMKF